MQKQIDFQLRYYPLSYMGLSYYKLTPMKHYHSADKAKGALRILLQQMNRGLYVPIQKKGYGWYDLYLTPTCSVKVERTPGDIGLNLQDFLEKANKAIDTFFNTEA